LADTVRDLRVPKLVIDHHIASDEPVGVIGLADISECAHGELVYDMARRRGFDVTPAIAQALYTAILTDTGSFRFSNATPRCHAVAPGLFKAGVVPEEMYISV